MIPELKWHRTSDGAVRAWGPRLYPTDTLPPYYRLVPVKAGRPPRTIELKRQGQEPVPVGDAENLAAAKIAAQHHYETGVTE